MIKQLLGHLKGWLGLDAKSEGPIFIEALPHSGNESLHFPQPSDDKLLEEAETQWQFGDWRHLIELEKETILHHPECAKLAILVAAGHLQQCPAPASRKHRQGSRHEPSRHASKPLQPIRSRTEPVPIRSLRAAPVWGICLGPKKSRNGPA